jgi:hypothetical protein
MINEEQKSQFCQRNGHDFADGQCRVCGVIDEWDDN